MKRLRSRLEKGLRSDSRKFRLAVRALKKKLTVAEYVRKVMLSAIHPPKELVERTKKKRMTAHRPHRPKKPFRPPGLSGNSHQRAVARTQLKRAEEKLWDSEEKS